MASPAYKLAGLKLEGGWTVGLMLEPGSDATGGNFSCCYHVTNERGTAAFLKALDFSMALRAPDPAKALQSLTEAYNFERDLLARCGARRMDRVVKAIADGKVTVNFSELGVVQYLILESADRDLRSQLSLMRQVDLAWKVRALHHMATGLNQLHGSNIAHQDLKPSNVLVFEEGRISKLADLGCASVRGSSCPRDDRPFAGDPRYAPPESLYGHQDPEWGGRRLGCDVYLLGSMVVFMFTGLSMTSLIASNLQPNFTWDNWTGSYQDVLPYVRDAFGKATNTFAEEIPEGALREELKLAVQLLCDPDPSKRGHPLNRVGVSSPFSLQRFVTRFDLLARRLESGLLS